MTTVDTSVGKLSIAMEKSYLEFEKQAMDLLLGGDDVTVKQLRSQWNSSVVKGREFTGVGFLTNFEIPKHLPRTSRANFEFGNGDAWISGVPIGFVLFVRE